MLRFSLRSIPIAVRPTFWVTVVLIGLQNGFDGARLAAWTVAVFAAVLSHELGHAFAARRFGADFIEVELYLLGGVTKWSAPEPLPPRRRLAVAAAGSGVGIVLGLLALAPLLLLSFGPIAEALLQSFVFAALVWGILNWVPIRSLDGGVMVASFFEWVFPSRGRLAAESFLFGFGVVALGAALLFGQWFIAAIVAFFGLSGFSELRDAWQERTDERNLAEAWRELEQAHTEGAFERAAALAESVVERAHSSSWTNKAHEEAVRNWYLAGILDRAVSAGDAWEEAGHHASWVAVQAYLDAGRTLDAQRLAALGLAAEPILAGPLALVDLMHDNQDRVEELVRRFPGALSTYLPMKVSDKIGPLDPYARRQVAQLLDRLPDVPLVQRVAALIEAGWPERALAVLDARARNPETEALRAHALFVLGDDAGATELLVQLAESPTLTLQVVAIRVGALDLAEEIGERLIDAGAAAQHVVLYNHACVASLSGRQDVAVQRAEQAIGAGFSVLRSLNFDPDLAAIRATTEFARLRTRAWQQQQVAFGNPPAQ